MGENEGSGLLANGLLPNAGLLIPFLDMERWSKAEERTAELIACIQPNQPSEERRNAVADYVQRLIMKCFPCQVFTFGSVPLKTYLPDGDIDLTAFSYNESLKDTWANEVRDMLENEEKNENAEFHVKEVQYIQAEVKIIKCLVENIVVDISFNQLGGLCTLCFLEEVDHLINQNHLFKRSIILIKAWCYYESRILGAHHGLISTYALETLVLYIFHIYNNSFAGPLEVLFRFLEFFSNFDWENFCVSLWGPVPVISLPDITAEPPRKDSGELLLSKMFLDTCSYRYAVFPSGQENQGQSFVSKHFNVIDPLRINNNLGRSVSKGNFFRIRSAFAFGAKRLARLLDCPEENLGFEVNQFFLNTWDRHGSGLRPDAPRTDLWPLRSSTPDNLPGSQNYKNSAISKKMYDNTSGHEAEAEAEVEVIRPLSVSSHHGKNPPESMSTRGDASAASHTDKGQRSLKPDHLVNDIQGRFVFARTRSSPELTDTYGDISSQRRHNRAPESGDSQATASADPNSGLNSYHPNRRKNPESELLPSHSGRSSSNDAAAAAGSNSVSNRYHRDSGFGVMSEELPSPVGAQGMHQEEQDLVNMMGFNNQVHMPLNLASAHLPFPISSSILTSMGYGPRGLTGMVPTNIPFIDPSMQFPHGMVSPMLSHYFSSVGMTSNSEDSIEMSSREADHELWQEQDAGSTGGFDSEKGNFEMLHLDDKPQLTSAGFNFVPPSRVGGPGSSMRGQQRYTKEKRGSMREDRLDNFQYIDNREPEVYVDERTTSSRFSLRSKTSSESSWDEPPTNVSKSTKENRGIKAGPAEPSTGYGKGKIISEHVSIQVEEDDQDWNPMANMGTEMAKRSSGSQNVASLPTRGHHMPDYEPAQTSGSDSMIPITPMIIGPTNRQRTMDNSGAVPFAFYPTGPPVPFLTMLPLYNMRPDAGNSDASTSRYGGDEGPNSMDSDQKFDSFEGRDQTDDLNSASSSRGAASIGTFDEHKSDILRSDLASHWQNLQLGRFCQNPRTPGPLVHPSPTYIQGRFPLDGSGRPLSANMNFVTQLMSYGHHLFPVAPLQSVANRPPNGYQRYADDMPRYRSGTGTYLPNPKVSVRDRHSSGTRRGGYNYDRSDSHGDREGNWNTNSKTRSAARSHNRSQNDKSGTRLDRLAASENRAERSWATYRQGPFPSYQAQNGPPLHSNSSQSGSHNMAYGMYPLQAMNPGGMSSNGSTVPSVVMLYPVDHNSGYGLHGGQLEFGSLGPVGFAGTNEQTQLSDGTRVRGEFEEHRFHGGSAQRSPEQPSSPHHQRRV